MPTYIIQHNNIFNMYTTVSDGCYFSSGLTLEELKEYYKEENGNQGMHDLDARLERALVKGTSAFNDKDLKDTISCNRAGEKESNLSFDDFVSKFLTINEYDRK